MPECVSPISLPPLVTGRLSKIGGLSRSGEKGGRPMEKRQPTAGQSLLRRGLQSLAVTLCGAIAAVQFVQAELRLPVEQRLETIEAQNASLMFGDPPSVELLPETLIAVALAALPDFPCILGRWRGLCIQ